MGFYETGKNKLNCLPNNPARQRPNIYIKFRFLLINLRVVKKVRFTFFSNTILIIQSIFSKIFFKKSWIKQMDENLHEYELRREGW